jgi:hypothetical protein
LKENVEGPVYTYPRYSSRALAEYLRVGQAVVEQSAETAPAVADIRVVSNLNDESVRPELTRAVAAAWQARGADVSLYEFPTDAGLKHDRIDPGQPWTSSIRLCWRRSPPTHPRRRPTGLTQAVTVQIASQ